MQRLSRWREDRPRPPGRPPVAGNGRALQRLPRDERPSGWPCCCRRAAWLAPAAEAIRDGMMTGYYSAEEAGNLTPDLRFDDVSDADVRSVFQRAVDDGARVRWSGRWARQRGRAGPHGHAAGDWLALNYLDQDSEDAPIFQFGLAPEDEARQIARQSLKPATGLAGGAVSAQRLGPARS